MFKINKDIQIPWRELIFTFETARGPGGQNVNKVATAARLRFSVTSCGLPEHIRDRLIALLGKKLTADGELVIKAGSFRTQEQNKQDALNRLRHWIVRAAQPVKKRKKTKASKAVKQRRLDSKKRHAEKKSLRKSALSK